MYLIGDVSPEERQHAELCEACQARISALVASLANFRGAVRDWSERSAVKDRAAEMRWTVIPATDHLERLLLPESIDGPWYRSLWSNLCEFVRPERAPLDLTSRPVLVRDIWGQYGRQKKSWVLSMALQSAAVLLVVTLASSKVVPRTAKIAVAIFSPVDSAYVPKAAPAPDKPGGGGGGGDRSPLPASKGRLPKLSLRQFTPPMALVNNADPKLTMEPSIIVPPDVNVPQVNMAQYGDPLAKLGPASNGPGSGGGIGSGSGGGVGSGKGGGFGPGEGGGVGGGVYRVGGGVTAPVVIFRRDPEYSEEARKAKYQGTVLLAIEVSPDGRAQNVRVVRSLGLGLDEKAMEAVKQWKFKPGYRNGQAVTVAATVEVNFRLL
jgi:protein TonB